MFTTLESITLIGLILHTRRQIGVASHQAPDTATATRDSWRYHFQLDCSIRSAGPCSGAMASSASKGRNLKGRGILRIGRLGIEAPEEPSGGDASMLTGEFCIG